MATIRKDVSTTANPAAVWAVIRDIGALHTRLVPGFVVDTKLEPGARIVTFGNGMTIREPIVTIDEAGQRLVWGAVGGPLTHYNASAQVFPNPSGGSTVVWIADLLPDEVAPAVHEMMAQGAAIMKTTLDALPST